MSRQHALEMSRRLTRLWRDLKPSTACDELDGKAKLGQNRTPAEIVRIVEQLWARGRPGDVRAVDLVLRMNPQVPPPEFLKGPGDVRLMCCLGESDADEATELLRSTYWQETTKPEKIRGSLLGSTAWVGARDSNGALVAIARAMSDGFKTAWLYDVIVVDERHRRGLGSAVVRLLLDHPSLRGVDRVLLNTRDAQGFYERFGFRTRVVPTDSRLSEMIFVRTNAKDQVSLSNVLASVHG